MIKCLRKGRTWRRRKLIRNDKYCDIYNVAFIQWLKENGFVNKSLQLSHFYDTSRGLRAKINFKENDVLISIPKQLLISTGTVESSFVGKLMRKFNKTISCIQCLSIFLIVENYKKENSKWYQYIQSLPKSYTNSLYWNEADLHCLPVFLQNNILQDQRKFISSLAEIKTLIKYLLKNLAFEKNIFTDDNFRWAYSCINTRCIFMKQIKTPSFVDESSDTFVLAPFLDLLNHSSNVSVHAEFNTLNDCYEIVTHCPYNKYEQVFINYGPHDNSKLLTEYGFIVSSNKNNVINISIEDILKIFDDYHGKQPSTKKRNFIVDNDLHKGMLLSHEGVSWNLKCVLHILLTESQNRVDWLKIMSAEEAQNDIRVKEFLLNMCALFLQDFNFRKSKCETISKDFQAMVIQLINEFLDIIYYNINILK